MTKKPGLYANINAKRERGEKMRKPGEEGAPSEADFKNAAKTAKKKKGQKREDPKGNPAGYYDSNKKKKADMGRKGPYADGFGKQCTCDAVAEELSGLLINDGERADKPCGASFIPERAKCSKGRGTGQKKKASKAKTGWANISKRSAQGMSAGRKVGAAVGAVKGFAAMGPMGALAGGLGGAIGGTMEGAVIGAGFGAAENLGRGIGKIGNRLKKNAAKNKKSMQRQKRLKANYRKAYFTGKAEGRSRKEMRELDMKYAKKFARS